MEIISALISMLNICISGAQVWTLRRSDRFDRKIMSVTILNALDTV